LQGDFSGATEGVLPENKGDFLAPGKKTGNDMCSDGVFLNNTAIFEHLTHQPIRVRFGVSCDFFVP